MSHSGPLTGILYIILNILHYNLLKDEVENTQLEHIGTVSSKVPHTKPGKAEELLLLKDQDIDLLNEQIGKLQAQLESATDNKVIQCSIISIFEASHHLWTSRNKNVAHAMLRK